MKDENNVIEYKSIRKIQTGENGLKDLSVTCVCLANTQGGSILIGCDDKTKLPPSSQVLTYEIVNDVVTRLRNLCFNVGLFSSGIFTHENGGQYFEIQVHRSAKSIATTSDGRIYLRVGDQCQPVRSEDIHHLVNEKEAFQWELVCSKIIRLSDVNQSEINNLINDIRSSAKVSNYVKGKTTTEILEYYNLIENNFLTNLGILWLGFSQQRARLAYPLTVQYIVYDALDLKIRKEIWHDYLLNPKDLILDIEKKAIELTYFHELPKGMFRESIRLYPEQVVRELLINAIAHKSYTISGDVFIQVYPDRLEISNSGGLPLGITKNNILHQRHRRNPHLINLLYDLNLMEGEGSGYDMIYEVNSRFGKAFPDIQSDFNAVKVIQDAKIIDEDSLLLLSHITEHYPLKQKEIIALGIIMRNRKILSTQFSKELQLPEEDRLRSWIGGLLSRQIIISRGHKKGTEYLINPKLIKSAKVNIKPSLITIEPHRLIALIEEDVKIYPESLMSEILTRIGDVTLKEMRKSIYKMVADGILDHTSSKTYRRYSLAKKNRI